MNSSRMRTPRVAAALAVAALMTTAVAVVAPGTSDAAGKNRKADRVEQVQQATADDGQAQERRAEVRKDQERKADQRKAEERQAEERKAAQKAERRAAKQAKAVAAAAAKAPWKPMWHSEFGTPRGQWPAQFKDAPHASLDAWTIFDRQMVSPDTKSQARYLKGNVDQSGGKLVITTRRVCATKAPTSSEDWSWLKTSRPSVDRCEGKRKHPVYTSGRLEMHTAAFQPTGANVRIDFRATLPTRPASGTRQALWANNATAYCNDKDKVVTNLGEVDAVEWYGNAPRESFSTTHMSCRGSGSDPWTTIRREHRDPIAAGSTHIWSVRKQGTSVSYYLDGKRVEEKSGKRPDTCGTAPFDVPAQADCNAIMNSPWMTILQGEVFKGAFKADKRQSGPDNRADFAKQQLKVDWVRVYTR